MSERPFMQLYVSDFIGDTLHLSTEQIGAYMLLLMAMWNAGGSLPSDDARLARVARLSLKKWKAIASDLMPFFDVDGDMVRHGRLTKELQKSESKSQSRASAGARGGAAKALKDKEAAMAIATSMPQHLPDTITREEKREPSGSPKKRGSRLPDDFAPDLGWAHGQGLSPAQAEREAAQFLDYWRAKTGPNATKADWPATWRTWVRKSQNDRPQPRGSPPQRTPPSMADIAHAFGERANGREDIEDRGGAGAAVPRLSAVGSW